MKAAVYIPSFNKAKYIGEAIASTLRQNAAFAYGVRILDNSSDGETIDKLHELQDFVPYSLLTVYYGNGNQPGKGYNEFVMNTDAEYLFSMQDDDLLKINFLSKMVEVLEQGKDVVYCGMDIEWEDGHRSTALQTKIFNKGEANSVEVLLEPYNLGIRRSALLKIGDPYEGDLVGVNNDNYTLVTYSFMRRLNTAYSFYPVGESLYTHRQTELSLSHH
jgi:glycosyltransferase involved in cell wall biosynthesis